MKNKGVSKKWKTFGLKSIRSEKQNDKSRFEERAVSEFNAVDCPIFGEPKTKTELFIAIRKEIEMLRRRAQNEKDFYNWNLTVWDDTSTISLPTERDMRERRRGHATAVDDVVRIIYEKFYAKN